MMFSIAIPAYKSAFLKDAVESVLGQTVGDWELVVVDDASPEDIRGTMAPFLSDERVHYYRNDKNFGALNVVDNWNRCLEYCSGEYVICMGDDDRMRPWCLEDYSSLMQKYPGLGLYHSRTEIIDGKGDVIEVLEKRPGYESQLEMLLARWKGRRQFIGDFCFHLPRLIGNGGFYKLPLAWASDDVSAFIAAGGAKPGVANTSRPGFQYRRNDATISLSANYSVKLSALMQSRDFYERQLSVMKTDSRREESLRRELLSILDSHYLDYSRQYVRADAARDFSKIGFWLSHRNISRLSVLQTLVQCLKGVVLK